MRLPGLDRPGEPVNLSCPYCNAGFSVGGPRRLRAGPVIVALIAGVGAGAIILWLDHTGMIALDNLEASRLLLEWKQTLRLFGMG